MNSKLLLACLAVLATKVSGQVWPSGDTTTGAPGTQTTGPPGTPGPPGTTPMGGCQCQACKEIPSGNEWAGQYLLWEGVGGRCGDECTYIRQGDNKVFCMCEPGPIPFELRLGCPFRPQCSRGNKCIEGQGDCDYDYECAGDLVCGSSNCNDKYHRTDDCCQKR